MKHSKGYLRIIACPGSGKTEVVSQRVANLIKNGADPDTIVAFTFTRKAAEELKTRIRRILDRECHDRADFGGMFIGTIHSFCMQMLKEIDPVYRSYDLLDEAKIVAFVSKPQNYRHAIGLERLKEIKKLEPPTIIKRFLESFDIVMMEDIDLDKISDPRFRSCIENYLRAADQEKYLDFSTAISRLVEILKTDRKKRELLGRRVRHVTLDEYQDVNRLQESLLELLSKKADSVCVVGDDDQSIYNWRGADVSIIRDFKKRHGKKKRVTDVHLNTNFRSTAALVYTSRKFIEHNRDRLEKKMVSNRRLKRRYEEGDIVHRHFRKEEDELDFIVKKIRGLVGTDFLDKRNNPCSLSPGDIAILTRTNAEAAKIADHLEKNGIVHITYSGKSNFDRPVVSLAADCIGYVFGCRGLTTYRVPEIDSLESRYEMVFRREIFQEASPSLFASRLEEVRAQADKIHKKAPKDYLEGPGFQEFYFKILNAMGAGDFEFGDAFHYSLAVLSLAISDYESVWTRLRTEEIADFVDFIDAYASSNYSDDKRGDDGIADAVKIMTVHKAKGLEFSAVFVPAFREKAGRNEKGYVDDDLYDAAMYAGGDEDERRIYYTAFTRAEKYLFITGSKYIHGKDSVTLPHRFLKEIPGKYISGRLVAKKPRSGLPVRPESLGMYSTSFSKLSSYNRCPYDFRLRHGYRYNAGVPASFGYGMNIHNALSVIHSDYIRNGRIPTDAQVAEIFDGIFVLRYATRRMAENMRKSGLKTVKNYVKRHKREFEKMLETEKNFEFGTGGTLVAGQIDLLRRPDEKGGAGDVEIVDFKADREDSAYRIDYERQLRYYALACRKSLDRSPKKAYVHHLADGSRSYVDISDERLGETEAEIGLHVRGILDKEFGAAPEKKKCGKCDYQAICSYKKFNTGAEDGKKST